MSICSSLKFTRVNKLELMLQILDSINTIACINRSLYFVLEVHINNHFHVIV